MEPVGLMEHTDGSIGEEHLRRALETNIGDGY